MKLASVRCGTPPTARPHRASDIDTLALDLSPLPQSLYKYRSLSGDAAGYTRDILVNNRLWFSTASTFNDPFDSFPYLSFEGPVQAYETYVARIVDSALKAGFHADRATLIQDILRQPREILEAEMQKTQPDHLQYLAVSCLSAVPDQVLMWSHYASSHTGICLRFNTRLPQTDLPDLAYKVAYQADRPIVNRVIAPDDYEQLFEAMLVKADFWAYEEEYRLFRPDRMNGAGCENFASDRLDGVIFGARCSPEDRQMVMGWIEERGGGVDLFEAIPDPRHYRLEARSLSR